VNSCQQSEGYALYKL